MQDGATSLITSAQKGQFEVVQLLLKRQANINAATKVYQSGTPSRVAGPLLTAQSYPPYTPALGSTPTSHTGLICISMGDSSCFLLLLLLYSSLISCIIYAFV